MKFYPGFSIKPERKPLGFTYGTETFGPVIETRLLKDIRKSLKNSEAIGPEEVYGIAMDVGNKADIEKITKRNLLYGAVTYAKGSIGNEPIRSQGHIHAISPSCGMSTPEIYEIWEGEAIIYMQETANDNPGRCFAVEAKAGEVVIVPPGWAHATINASVTEYMSFGAWCVRDFGFEYDDVRQHHGLAWFPVIENNNLQWEANDLYEKSELIIKKPRIYSEFSLVKDRSIYEQFRENPDMFLFVAQPEIAKNKWEGFTP